MKFKKTIIFLMSFIILSTSIFIHNDIRVRADAGDVLLADFDDISSGLDSGISGFIEFFNYDDPNAFETSTSNSYSAPNSFKIGTGITNWCYWNLTDDFVTIDEINLSWYCTVPTSGNACQVQFLDNASNIVIYFRYYGDKKFYWYDDVGWQLMYYPGLSDKRVFIVISHNGTNQFNIKFYNTTFAVVGNYDLAGYYAADYTNFTQIRWKNDLNTIQYIDNFYINILSEEESDLEGEKTCNTAPNWDYKSQPNYYGYLEIIEDIYLTTTIYGAELYFYYDGTDNTPEPVYFSMRVNGIPAGIPKSVTIIENLYRMQWIFDTPIEIENQQPLFTIALPYQVDHNYPSICFGDDATGRSGFHDTFVWALDNNFQGSHHWLDATAVICYYIDANYSVSPIPPIDEDDLLNWTNLFNSELGVFCEVYNSWFQCYYRVDGRYLELIYNVSDDYLTDTVDFYKAILYDSSDNKLYTQLIYWNENQTSGHITTNYKFTKTGTYYLLLWNTSNNGATLRSVVDVGNYPVYVCPKSGGTGGGGDWIVLPTIQDSGLAAIMGLIVVIFCLLIPFIFAGLINARTGSDLNPPMFVYAITGALGIGVVTYLEWFPSWIIAFIIIAGIIITAILYITKGRVGE